MRPAATSSRTCSADRCGSRSATRSISVVMCPSRACSSCVIGSKPSGATAKPVEASRVQPLGRKSQAVLSDGGGMPGVSGELKLSGPPMSGGFAKLPGVVPLRPGGRVVPQRRIRVDRGHGATLLWCEASGGVGCEVGAEASRLFAVPAFPTLARTRSGSKGLISGSRCRAPCAGGIHPQAVAGG